MTRIRVVTSADVGLTANRFSATLLVVASVVEASWHVRQEVALACSAQALIDMTRERVTVLSRLARVMESRKETKV